MRCRIGRAKQKIIYAAASSPADFFSQPYSIFSLLSSLINLILVFFFPSNYLSYKTLHFQGRKLLEKLIIKKSIFH